VILRLSNPELLREMETTHIALAQEEANLRRLQLTNQRELLNEQATLAELNAQLQAISLRREAEQGLAGGAVSQLTYKTTLLQEQQFQERVKLQHERIAQLKKVGQEAVLIQQKQISRAESQCREMQARVDALTVKAGIKGLVQRLPVELGQSLSAGQELALVGSDKDLKALIRVSQSHAEQLQIGQAAQIKIRQQSVAGRVARITPEVRDGTIEVEILIEEPLPPAARPELNVDARIFVATLKDALFIERPVNVQGNSNASLYRFRADKNIAEAQQVSFGEDSDKYIQIKSGAQEQDQFILSDMNNYRDAQTLRLVN
jgi:biotin carboxyl carrier protein